MPRQAPNILFIQADQMAAPALPFHGHPVVKAPHMAALAREGVVFDNAYCNAPLCTPSRCSMLTGLYPSDIEVYDNAAELPASVPTIAHHLRHGPLRAKRGTGAPAVPRGTAARRTGGLASPRFILAERARDGMFPRTCHWRRQPVRFAFSALAKLEKPTEH